MIVNKNLLFVTLSVLFMLMAFVGSVAAQREYHLEHEWAKIWTNQNGSIDLLYDINITLDSGPTINYVYIGQPKSDFTIGTAMDQYGHTLVASDASSGSDYKVQINLYEPLTAGETVGFNLTTNVAHMIYEDTQNPGNVGMKFIPTWWEEASVLDLQVQIVLPPGVTVDNVTTTEELWNGTFPEDDRLSIFWQRGDLSPNQKYTFGVSFPKEFVQEYTGRIHILPDGSIDPPTANISTVDYVTYTFIGDIHNSIVIEKDNIAVDGAGFTVQGGGNGTGIDLSDRSNVTIKNMEISGFEYGISLYVSSNNTISANNITNNLRGINLDSSSNNNTLTGNTVAGNSQWGIGVGGSINNVISGNNITENPGYGILLAGSPNNTISANNITNNNYGILLYVSSKNTVSRNKIMANYICGTILRNSSNNIISGNTITNNDVGIGLDEFPNNIMYHNNFIDNTQQVHIEPSGYSNFWDNGVEGNYWSNYTGVDVDGGGDGVGDAPHVIDLNNTDNHPLMGPVRFFDADTWNEETYYIHTASNSTVSDFNFSQSNQVVSFNVTGSNGTAGFCRVAIPRELLWCEDIFDWTVRVNGTVVPIRIQEHANYTYLYFNYSHSVQNVKIYGTHVIPEFPTFLILPLFMIVTLLATVVFRRKIVREG